MTRRVFHGLADVAAAVGGEVGVSPWMVIDQERIDAFARVTDDHQWIHVDPERAEAGPFGATVAHGYLTLSLVTRFATEVFSIEGLSERINYGSDRVRFPAPVRVGSRLRGRVGSQSSRAPLVVSC